MSIGNAIRSKDTIKDRSLLRKAVQYIENESNFIGKIDDIGDPAFIFRHENFHNKCFDKSVWELQFNEITSSNYDGFGLLVRFQGNKPIKLEDQNLETASQWYDDESKEWVDF